MKNNKIKIYIADEKDTLESVCQKFNIQKHILLIFNPLLKNKTKLSNTPIKIPYQNKNVEERKEIKCDKKEKEIDHTYVFLMKDVIIAKYYNLPTFNEEKNILKNYLENNTSLSHLSDKIINFIEIITTSSKESFDQYFIELDKIKENMNSSLMEIEELSSSLLKYIVCLQTEEYQTGSLIIRNLISN